MGKHFPTYRRETRPIKEKTVNDNKTHVPWFNTELEELLKEKNKRLQLYWLDGYFTNLKLLKAISNKITRLKRKLKKIYCGDKIQQHEGDPKKMWQVLKELVQIKT